MPTALEDDYLDFPCVAAMMKKNLSLRESLSANLKRCHYTTVRPESSSRIRRFDEGVELATHELATRLAVTIELDVYISLRSSDCTQSCSSVLISQGNH